jgi:hypothetical protein
VYSLKTFEQLEQTFARSATINEELGGELKLHLEKKNKEIATEEEQATIAAREDKDKDKGKGKEKVDVKKLPITSNISASGAILLFHCYCNSLVNALIQV